MFSVPKLGSSLGFIGNDPKLAFRTQPNGIARLAEKTPIAETDDGYWSQYVLLFDTASDVYTLITPPDIRRALIESPLNIATLVRVITRRLKNLLLDHTFPSPPSSILKVPKFGSWSSLNGTGLGDRDTTKEVLNCLRVLGRVLPVIFELPDDSFEEELFWRREVVPPPSPDIPTGESVVGESSQFVIDDDDDDDETTSTAAKTVPQSQPQKAQAEPPKTLPSLAEDLFGYVIDLMFCCGFTLPTSIQVDHHKIQYVIWDKGIGSTTHIESNSLLDSHKSEVLRLLLILLSRTIYHSPTEVLSRPNKWTAHLVHGGVSRRLVLSILCSLLNTAMNPDGAGAGGAKANVAGMVDKVPYNHLILARKGDEGRAGLVRLCLGVLCVLLEYQVDEEGMGMGTASSDGTISTRSGGSGGLSENGSMGERTTQQQQQQTPNVNAFRFYIAKLHQASHFDFILDGVISILAVDLANNANFLPGSRKPVPYILETFVFFWKVLELSKKFRAHLLESEKLLDIIAYLLCYLLENKDKEQHHGLCRALSYIMQSLSAERRFGMQMQNPMPTRIPIPPKWAAIGAAGDFFVSSIYSIVATTSGSLNSLYPALIIALANIAPYLKSLSVKSSNRLVHLFSAFSNPLFLLADDSHPRLVFFMLEALNGILFHQLADNANVFYAILQAHTHFEQLGTFTLAKGLAEVRRVQQLKEEHDAKKTTSTPSSGKVSDATGTAPEKASLMRGSSERERDELFNAEDGLATEMEQAALRSPPPTGQAGRELPESDSVPPSPGGPGGMSEKARGKMRETERRSSVSEDVIAIRLDPELERIAAAGVGRNGFVPTQEWVTSWQQGLPLDPILLTISELLPKVMDLQTSLSRPTTSAVFQFLRSASLQDVLPPAPPLAARRFQWSDASRIWLTSLIWGSLYVHGTSYLGIWSGTSVRLFGVRQAPSTPRAGIGMNMNIGNVGEAVQNVMGGFGWGGGSPGPTTATGAPLGHAQSGASPVISRTNSNTAAGV